MLTIKKIITTEEIQNYLDKEKISHTIGQEQFMGIYDGDSLIGIGSISLVGLKVYLNFIYTGEDVPDLQHGLAKALLNMADLSGIQTVYGSEPALFELYTRLRFKREENGEYTLPLEGYFTVDSCQN